MGIGFAEGAIHNTAINNCFDHHFQTSTAPPSRFRTFPAWMALGSLDKAFHRGKWRKVVQ